MKVYINYLDRGIEKQTIFDNVLWVGFNTKGQFINIETKGEKCRSCVTFPIDIVTRFDVVTGEKK